MGYTSHIGIPFGVEGKAFDDENSIQYFYECLAPTGWVSYSGAMSGIIERGCTWHNGIPFGKKRKCRGQAFHKLPWIIAALLKCFTHCWMGLQIDRGIPFGVEGKAFDNGNSIQRLDECLAPTGCDERGM
jgi:hypothetical protein